jgi:ABC-type phosphate transport system substrate-binding protein
MMNHKTSLRRCVLAAALACANPSLDSPLLAQGAETLVMVVNKANPSASLTKSDAKRLVLGQTISWPGGGKVVLVMKPEQSADRASVLQKVCGMSEAEYTRYEMQVVFAGRPAAAVQIEPSSAAIKSFVKANPGAVGFVHQSEVDSDLKAVLSIE